MIPIRNRGSHPFLVLQGTKDRTRCAAACKAPPFQPLGEKSGPALLNIDPWITVERASLSSGLHWEPSVAGRSVLPIHAEANAARTRLWAAKRIRHRRRHDH